MMFTPHTFKPVTVDQVDIRIIIPEESIRYRYLPDAVFLLCPVSDPFRAFYLDLFTGAAR